MSDLSPENHYPPSEAECFESAQPSNQSQRAHMPFRELYIQVSNLLHEQSSNHLNEKSSNQPYEQSSVQPCGQASNQARYGRSSKKKHRQHPGEQYSQSARHKQRYRQQETNHPTPVTTQPNVTFVQPYETPESHMAFAICTCFFCCCPLGLIAIILSSMSEEALAEGDYENAAITGKVSLGFSFAAFTCGIVILCLATFIQIEISLK